MTLLLKHSFVSAKTDGPDPSVLKPSDWNANHSLTCATNVILGRRTASTGAVEELPTSTAMIDLLANTSIANFLAALGISPPETGDACLTLKTTATTGWVMLNDGTIGNATSGATLASATTAALFTLLYNNVVDANCPVLTSAGGATTRAAQGSAATAYAASCRMSLPKQLGRAFVAAGAGSGLTSRALGSNFGAETATLVAANLPPITSVNASQAISVLSQKYIITSPTQPAAAASPSGTTIIAYSSSGTSELATSTGNNSISVTSSGTTSTPFNLTPASAAWNVMVKL